MCHRTGRTLSDRCLMPFSSWTMSQGSWDIWKMCHSIWHQDVSRFNKSEKLWAEASTGRSEAVSRGHLWPCSRFGQSHLQIMTTIYDPWENPSSLSRVYSYFASALTIKCSHLHNETVWVWIRAFLHDVWKENGRTTCFYWFSPQSKKHKVVILDCTSVWMWDSFCPVMMVTSSGCLYP